MYLCSFNSIHASLHFNLQSRETLNQLYNVIRKNMKSNFNGFYLVWERMKQNSRKYCNCHHYYELKCPSLMIIVLGVKAHRTWFSHEFCGQQVVKLITSICSKNVNGNWLSTTNQSNVTWNSNIIAQICVSKQWINEIIQLEHINQASITTKERVKNKATLFSSKTKNRKEKKKQLKKINRKGQMLMTI